MLGADSDWEHALQGDWLRELPYPLADYGLIRNGRWSFQCAGQSLLRFGAASHGRQSCGRHHAGKCRPGPIPHGSFVGTWPASILPARWPHIKLGQGHPGSRRFRKRVQPGRRELRAAFDPEQAEPDLVLALALIGDGKLACGDRMPLHASPVAARGSRRWLVCAPDFAGRIYHQREFLPLFVNGKQIARGRGCKTALRADRQILQRHEFGGLVDSPPQFAL